MIALGALAGSGVAAAAVSMTLLHPHQQVYFNGLEDRTTPWRLRERYDFAYWGPAVRAGMERARDGRPGGGVRICGRPGRYIGENVRILRREDRARLPIGRPRDACEIALFWTQWLVYQGRPGDRPMVPPAWSLAAYGSPFLELFAMADVRAARRRTDDPVLARPPDIAAAFDVRRDGRWLVYARDDCAQEALAARFFLHVEPMDPADLPADRRGYGFDNLDFETLGAPPAYSRSSRRALRERAGDRCVVTAPLPDYPIRRVRTGQIVPDGGGGWRSLWEGEIDLTGGGRR